MTQTETERKYMQIEKKMLAIVYGCENFNQCIYGHKLTVETDHKPLMNISQKSIHNAPKHLKWMLLHMQYDCNITYKKGFERYLGDTFSRAYPEHPVTLSRPQSEFCHAAMEVLDLTEHFRFQATEADSRSHKHGQHVTSKYFQGGHYGSLKYICASRSSTLAM